MIFCCRLFTAQPSYQSYFSFRNVPDLETLRGDKRLKAHARNVMYTIGMVVDNLEDPEVLQEMVDKIARSHLRRKLTIEQFNVLKEVLVGLLVDSLGAGVMTPETLTAWSKTYDLFTDAMTSQAKGQEEQGA